MPNVTININAPGEQLEQDLITLELPSGLTIADLKALVEAETQLPAQSQHYYYNGQALRNDTQTLDALGVKDGEMMAMMVNRGSGAQSQTGGARVQSSAPNQQQSRATNRQQQLPALDPARIEQTRQRLAADPTTLTQLIQAQPRLAEAIHDPTRFLELWKEMKEREEQEQLARNNEIALLNDDPFNEDAQRRIEEIIRRERIEQNRQYAYEHNPEVFVHVTMLYVNVKVNGHPVKAFVDSGAQSTIMSPSCAERCNIHSLIDERYAGIARGVGTAKILGRVHNAKIEIGDAELDCSFTVMEGKDVDLLFGLDMLRRHQACIDLTRNELRFPHTTVKFLGESDIPQKFEESLMDEPVVQGPDGTEIGAKTGTVRPAGSAAAAAADLRGGGQTLGGPSSSSSASKTGSGATPAAAAAAAAQARDPASGAARNTSGTSTSQSAIQQSQSQPPQGRNTQNQPASSTAQPRPSARTFPEKDIEQIVNIGFSRQEAIMALEACNGNVEFAASLLFQQMQ